MSLIYCFQTSNGTFDAGFAKLSHLHHRYFFANIVIIKL